MVGSRRVRRRSVPTCPFLPTYVALLEPLHLRMQSARDSKRPLFILQVQRRSISNNDRHSSAGSNNYWSAPRPFEEFEALHKRMIMALQHGHFCNAGCPWLFSFLTSEFPKKHIFQRNFSPKTVETRREKLLELLTSTVEFLLDRKNHKCTVATIDVAKLLVEFLYGDDTVAHFSVKSLSESETSSSSNNYSQLQSLGVWCEGGGDTGSHDNNACSMLSICGVCNGSLVCQVNDRPRISRVNSSSRRRSSVYETVLQCGHQFHDECIVPVLHETLRCPTCHHLEIQ
ncbi:uncharacterized protein PITG_15543 [Phytophthora infestans T30-4]|uniref:RING-type domain-containing protein n=2 Tax=Phytophthora infestans TaxID=4787 RepID=D0NT14_PHYIT|nr:uncharacterized protein PITG_15543 [Phytophthora infestans T30-4]EEY64770.1 conserved hypothetical protein [Phytophthora infestans T30-4]KAF4046408.1 C3HC4 type (RING finger) zinc finger protein [Phytophthora infestans]KAF4133472.1 C3HC4 type zinc finger [Phytophthora infestans]|eukprot:XP_002897697.1 conserved hypothetical protein [Phytophthora infestans T30-4]